MLKSRHGWGYSLVVAGLAAGSALTPPLVSRLMLRFGWRHRSTSLPALHSSWRRSGASSRATNRRFLPCGNNSIVIVAPVVSHTRYLESVTELFLRILRALCICLLVVSLSSRVPPLHRASRRFLHRSSIPDRDAGRTGSGLRQRSGNGIVCMLPTAPRQPCDCAHDPFRNISLLALSGWTILIWRRFRQQFAQRGKSPVVETIFWST